MKTFCTNKRSHPKNEINKLPKAKITDPQGRRSLKDMRNYRPVALQPIIEKITQLKE